MPHVEMTKELAKRIAVLESQYDNSEAFAAAMGVNTSAVRYWKTMSRNMSMTAYLLFQIREKEKLRSKK